MFCDRCGIEMDEDHRYGMELYGIAEEFDNYSLMIDLCPHCAKRIVEFVNQEDKNDITNN